MHAAIRLIEWCRRLCVLVLVALSCYDGEWGFVIVLLIAEGLGLYVRELRVQEAEIETVGRVRRAAAQVSDRDWRAPTD